MLTGGQNLKRAVFVGESDIMPHAADPEQINEAWNTIRSGLRRDLGARVFNQWLRAIVPGSFCADTGTLDLLAPSAFVANYIASNFGQRLRLGRVANHRDDVGHKLGRYGDLSTPTTHREVRDVEPRIRHQYRDRLRT